MVPHLWGGGRGGAAVRVPQFNRFSSPHFTRGKLSLCCGIDGYIVKYHFTCKKKQNIIDTSTIFLIQLCT
jgi:hypothetical protein